ncbi:transmembrane protein 258-like [Hibiscus syriacus]|uniref:transmembrane protein 258-like n=1 Tax=Hibiscus syriacus TaxID=106335 RepID=UPI001924AF16|nr:transmembrane protein 258-like [Hibiscus syriacus]
MDGTGRNIIKFYSEDRCNVENASAAKALSSPVPIEWYPTLAVVLLSIGLVVTASFFIYEATCTKRNRYVVKELITGGVASLFSGFGSLFLLLSAGVYV